MLSGPLTDRIGPRTLTLAGQGLTVVVVGGAAVIAGLGAFTVPMALLLALALGTSDGLYNVPAQAIVPRLVDGRLMGSAIALSPLQYAAGRFLGGMVIALGLSQIGPSVTLGGAAIAFGIAFLVFLSLPRIRGLKGGAAKFEFGDIREVVAWLRSSRVALAVFATGIGASAFTYTYLFLLPVVSRDLVNGGSIGYGLMTAASGVGYIVAAFLTVPIARRLGHGRAMLGALAVAGVFIFAIGLSRMLPLTILLAGGIAIFLIVYSSISNLLLQTLVRPEMRGRILALYTCMFWGLQPVASVTAGLLADRVGVQAVLFAAAIGTIAWVAGVAILARTLVRTTIDPEGHVISSPA
jgi:MFS family permease